MPGRPHHSAKMKDCVDKLIADGKEEDSAYAICTASLQKAGEPIFEAAELTDLTAEETAELEALGGAGSGNFGHTGRPGEVGGSEPSKEQKSASKDAERASSRAYKAGHKEEHLDAAKAHEAAAKMYPKGSEEHQYHKESAEAHKENSKEPGADPKLGDHVFRVPLDVGHIYVQGKNASHAASRARRAGYKLDEIEMKQRINRKDPGEHIKRADIISLEHLEGESVGESRYLHLLGATGAISTKQLEGRDHIVVPVIALMEGVIHAVNAACPEFVPISALTVAPQGWNGRPLMYGHPVKNGTQISANDPTVLETGSFGKVFNARVEGKKLLMDAYIDPIKAEKIGAHKMLERIQNGGMVEVSVGAFVTTETKNGDHNGKPYKAVWKDVVPDHLAFLENKKGACSGEMGCGCPRVAMVAEPDGFRDMTDAEFKAAEELIDAEVELAAANAKVEELKEEPIAAAGARHSADDMGMIQGMHDLSTSMGAYCSTEPRTAEDAFIRSLSPLMDNAHVLVSQKQVQQMHDHAKNLGAKCNQMTVYESVELKDLRSISQEERDKLPDNDFAGPHRSFFIVEPEDVSNAAQSLGRTTGNTDTVKANIIAIAYRKGPSFVAKLPDAWKHKADTKAAESTELKAACSCGGDKMTAEARAEVIKTLVANRHSGFMAGDEKMLEAASDERLEALMVAAGAREKEVTAAAEAAKPKQLTEEDFMRVAPPEIKSLITRTQRAETERKAELVAALKAAQSEFTESELSAMKLEDLERQARVMKLEETEPPVNYIGRGLPRSAAAQRAEDVYANPPDPYADGLKALQARMQ